MSEQTKRNERSVLPRETIFILAILIFSVLFVGENAAIVYGTYDNISREPQVFTYEVVDAATQTNSVVIVSVTSEGIKTQKLQGEFLDEPYPFESGYSLVSPNGEYEIKVTNGASIGLLSWSDDSQFVEYVHGDNFSAAGMDLYDVKNHITIPLDQFDFRNVNVYPRWDKLSNVIKLLRATKKLHYPALQSPTPQSSEQK